MSLLKRVVIVGAGGRVGSALYQRLGENEAVPWTRETIDIRDKEAVARQIAATQPRAVVIAAGMTGPRCETDGEACWQANCVGACNIFRPCAKTGVPVVLLSCGDVFSGRLPNPACEKFGKGFHREDCPARPGNQWGMAKIAAEHSLMSSDSSNWGVGFRRFVVRTSMLYGGPRRDDLVDPFLERARMRQESLPTDVVRSPTYLPHFIDSLTWLLNNLKGVPHGVYHVASLEPVSLHEFGEELHRQFLLAEDPPFQIRPGLSHCLRDDFVQRLGIIPRAVPRYNSLCCEKWSRMRALAIPPWREGLKAFMTNDLASRA